MRAQLLHLSGPLRGRTVTYEARVVHIGSATDVEARIVSPAVAPLHAQIEFVEEECQFHVKRGGGQVFVNGAEVSEVILQDGDQLELGAGGPMVRFHIYVPIGAVCKPMRRMLVDAVDVARVSGGAAATQSLGRDLLTQASPQLKVVFPLAVVAGAFLAGWLGGLLGQPDRELMVTRAELEALREQQAKQQPVDTVTHAELETLREQQKKQQEDVARLARANAIIRLIQRELSRGVCLMHGVYRLRQADGSWFQPDTEPFEIEYSGSGFLATAAGHVITNRHVVAPWLEDRAVMQLVERGAEPVFVHLTATFPDKQPLDVPVDSILRRKDDLDVAVVQLPADQLAGVPVLRLHDGPVEGDDQTAIVVGYPTGLAVLLARAEDAFVDALRQRSASMTETIAELAATKQIMPTITRGVVSTVQENKITYDAVTTHGGSGGPVFDTSGDVIAVNYAIMVSFSGANFGVPIRYARELLPQDALPK